MNSKYSIKHYVDLGPVVADIRKARGLTQRQLAALAGLGTSTLARFETGGVAEFGSSKLMRLLGALDCAVAITTDTATARFTLDDVLAQQQARSASGTNDTGISAPAGPRRRMAGTVPSDVAQTVGHARPRRRRAGVVTVQVLSTNAGPERR